MRRSQPRLCLLWVGQRLIKHRTNYETKSICELPKNIGKHFQDALILLCSSDEWKRSRSNGFEFPPSFDPRHQQTRRTGSLRRHHQHHDDFHLCSSYLHRQELSSTHHILFKMTDLKQRKYIRWDAPGVEEVPANETEDIDAVKELFHGIQCYYSKQNGHCFGGTHARTQGIVKGKLTVPNDLPHHLKQTELFQHGGEFDFICRYSSEPSDPKLDVRSVKDRHAMQWLTCRRTGSHSLVAWR